MLERIPAAKAAIRSPARAPTKDSLVAAMKAQRPIIDNIQKDPQIILSKLTGADAALRERITSDPQDGLDLALLLILSGRIDEEKTPEGRLPLPLPVPQDVLALAMEVGAIWDNQTRQDRDRIDIPGGFADPSSEMSALFSLRTDSRISMGSLLANAEDKSRASQIEYLKILFSFMNGELDLDGLKKYYAERETDLKYAEAQKSEDRILIKIGENGENPGYVTEIGKRLGHMQKTMAKLLEQVAKRMSVGFSPLL